MRFKRHGWDAERAREAEFKVVANRLLGLVGGSIGAKREEGNNVVIGIGIGQFACKTGLPSVHGSFMSFFVRLARSLGFIVVGVNEFLRVRSVRLAENSFAKSTYAGCTVSPVKSTCTV
ncbi:hypothetical protein BGX24_008152, partial [Mortierella sp. AD032]